MRLLALVFWQNRSLTVAARNGAARVSKRLSRRYLALGLLFAQHAAVQCSQCFRTGAAQKGATMEALNSGILILLFLVVAMLAGER